MRFGSFLSAFLALAFGANAYAGAWVQPEGKGLVIGSATYYATDSFFDVNGNKQVQPTFSKLELQPYVEYGALEWLTVGGSAYLQGVSQSGRTNYGIADPEIFARARVYRDDRQVVSVQPLIKFASAFTNSKPPRGGSKSTDAELSVLYGRNVKLISERDYIDSRIGYRIRDNGLGDQIRGDVSLGLGATDSIDVIPAIRSVVTPYPTTTAFTNSGDLDYNVLKLEIAGVYHLDDKQWLQATLFSHVMGVQTGGGGGISLSYARNF